MSAHPRALDETEAGFQSALIELAQVLGWRVHAERAARTATCWRTPIQGDPGWPDLVLCRPPRLVIAELKVKSRQPSADQWTWVRELGDCAIEAYVWWPKDWESIETILRRR